MQTASSSHPIAVVGSGISGLSAAWLLSQHRPVVVLEANPQLGGHSNTVDMQLAIGETVPVDTGFIVYNPPSYPNLVALFDHLNVETAQTVMSFAVTLDRGRYEYSGTGFNGIFAQRRNLVSVRHWTMIRDILRFFSDVRELDDASAQTLTLDEFLSRKGYTKAFRNEHILPMAAAIWSAPAEIIGAFPMASFARFFANHGLLQVKNRPEWRTVVGGSRNYVNAIADRVRQNGGEIRLNAAVSTIERKSDGVHIRFEDGSRQVFSDVVIATHGDTALSLLHDAGEDEQRVLSAFRYCQNEAYLHTDASLMPQRRKAWASWNYVAETRNASPDVCITYWMNELQPLKTAQDIFVSLNPVRTISPAKIHSQYSYTHPIFDGSAMAAQKQLWSLQGTNRTWFCGSYFGYGFHEDGAQSGLAVAEAITGVSRPWTFDPALSRIHVSAPTTLNRAA